MYTAIVSDHARFSIADYRDCHEVVKSEVDDAYTIAVTVVLRELENMHRHRSSPSLELQELFRQGGVFLFGLFALTLQSIPMPRDSA